MRVGLRTDASPDLRGDLENLEDALAAAKSGEGAPFAAFRLMDDIALAKAEGSVSVVLGEINGRHGARRLAVLAKDPHQPLADDGANA